MQDISGQHTKSVQQNYIILHNVQTVGTQQTVIILRTTDLVNYTF